MTPAHGEALATTWISRTCNSDSSQHIAAPRRPRGRRGGGAGETGKKRERRREERENILRVAKFFIASSLFFSPPHPPPLPVLLPLTPPSHAYSGANQPRGGKCEFESELFST